MKINKKKEYSKPADADFNLHTPQIDELFPEISKIKKTVPVAGAENKVMNYLENTKKPTIQVTAPHNPSPKETAPVEMDDFNYLEVNLQMSKMMYRWDEYTKTYIMLYGDDIYDKMYLFPNYNYEYFDMLDNKYEYEQEEMEIAEKNVSYEDLSDYYICDKYDL
jgi:hypothetical protein